MPHDHERDLRVETVAVYHLHRPHVRHVRAWRNDGTITLEPNVRTAGSHDAARSVGSRRLRHEATGDLRGRDPEALGTRRDRLGKPRLIEDAPSGHLDRLVA